jgi:hypothetical protein
MIDPRIRLKNRFLAVILAWLLPGAGHFYQERRLKSAIYFCSIVGLWVMAMHLSEWKVMAAPYNERNERPPLIQVLRFGAQSGIGLPAVCSVVQRERARNDENAAVRVLKDTFQTEFTGRVSYPGERATIVGDVTGTVSFTETQGQFGPSMEGSFKGTTTEGLDVDVELNGAASLGRPVDGDHRRTLTAQITREGDSIGDLRGTISRSPWNWLFVPLNAQQEMDLHRRLGKFHELATLLSVVAGLLNILVIFDAYGGPAYGYGDEEPIRVPGSAAAAKPTEGARPPAVDLREQKPVAVSSVPAAPNPP